MGNPLRNITTVAAVLAAGCMALVSSCSTDGCMENRSSIPRAEFYSSDGTAITLDSLEITGVGAPDDSALVKAGTKVSAVNLPMRSSQTSTSWCFSYKWNYLDTAALNDTIRFDYDSLPWFASEECGAMYRYRITRISWTDHLVDSVVALDSLITNMEEVQLRIYFRTQDEEPDPEPGPDPEPEPDPES